MQIKETQEKNSKEEKEISFKWQIGNPQSATCFFKGRSND